MDGAEAGDRYLAATAEEAVASKRARGWWGRRAVMQAGTAPGADLGGSSKDSEENIED